jgi:hypothetical protein
MKPLKFKKGDKVYVKRIPGVASEDNVARIENFYPDRSAVILSIEYDNTMYRANGINAIFNFSEHDLEPWVEPDLLDEELFEI